MVAVLIELTIRSFFLTLFCSNKFQCALKPGRRKRRCRRILTWRMWRMKEPARYGLKVVCIENRKV